MFDLFLDMTALFISERPTDRMPGSHLCYNQTEVYKTILESNLVSELKKGLGALSQED